MLTLRELRNLVTIPECPKRIPTAKQLIESGSEIIAKEVLARETAISVYVNGYVLYQSGKHYTVFSIGDCETYEYESAKGYPLKYELSFFENENWYVRLIMEAEDRLEKNQERIKAFHKVCSYDRLIEECGEIPSGEEDILESLSTNDLVKRMLGILNERQREIVYLFYFEQWKQKDIAEYFKTTQQNISDMINRVLRILYEYANQEEKNFLFNL